MSRPMASAEVPRKQPEPFPESDADSIRQQASYLDTLGDAVTVTTAIKSLPLTGARQDDSWSAAMEAFFEYVKSILGDYTKVRDLALEWAEVSNVPMDIREDLRDLMGAVDGYWTGPAFDAFQTHIDALNETLTDTTGKMIEIARTLENAITLVFDTWSSVVSHITTCAVNIGGTGNPKLICDSLLEMSKDTMDLIEKAGRTMGRYVRDLAKIDIRPLPDNDDSLKLAGNEDGWEVKPAPGS
ncbi:WXG100 family type VII secretion target [Actinophytocola sediminis]